MFFFFRYEEAIILFTYILLTVYVDIEPLKYIPYFILQLEQYCFKCCKLSEIYTSCKFV